MFSTKPYLFILFFIALFCSKLSANNDIRVYSRFNPTHLSVGQAGIYEIIVEGSCSAPSGKGVPGQQGLVIKYRGEETSYQIVNGHSSSRCIYTYSVIPQAPGSYTLSEYSISVDGKNYTVNPCTLEVTPSATAVAASSYFAGQSVNTSQNQEAQASSSPYVFLELKIERTNLYVGETIPCQINLGIREGSSYRILSAGPEPIGAGFDAFSFNPAREPRQTRQQRGPLVYQETLWPTAMTPLKTGVYSINFGLNVAVQVPTQPQGTQDEYLAYSILSNLLANVETLNLETQAHQIQINPLPTEGKPMNFTGAIGSFNAQQLISTSNPEIGEPITLTLIINGTGNFDRIQAPALNETSDWKSYPPRVDFTAEDAIGYQGSKRIQYIIIPLNESIESTPRLYLNYFDPVAGKYCEISPEPLPLQIKSILNADQNNDSSNHTPYNLINPNKNNGIEDPSFSLMSSLGPIVDRIQSNFFTINFWIFQIIVGIGLFIWFMVRHRQLRYLQDDRFAHRKHTLHLIKVHWQMLSNAAHTSNHNKFLAQAQKIFQIVLSDTNESQSLTWEEIVQRLDKRAAPANLQAMAYELAQKSGSWQFGGGLAPDAAQLKVIQTQIQSLLIDLKSLL